MRQIKFRAWDSVRKVMHLNASKVGESLYWDNGTSYNHMAFIYPKEEGERYFLMQFTGLKDKNGVDIYEGDIVRILYTDWPSKNDSDKRTLEEYTNDISKIGVVKYFPPEYGLQFKGFTGDLLEGRHGEKEVIGNIYQNPELLTDKN